MIVGLTAVHAARSAAIRRLTLDDLARRTDASLSPATTDYEVIAEAVCSLAGDRAGAVSSQ
ncbi:hypothetical protein GCM10009727_58650 [Actinomadura napierensis]|uniref:Uncharacterized protein n=1 Tax=Actinomadura napierensis TaxID=267854 RepID=A0ABN3A2R0_9ACTN